MTTVTPALSTREPLPGASAAAAMGRFVGNAFRLRGRASRSEYWWWMLVNVLVLAVAQIAVPMALTGHTPEATIAVGPFGSLLHAYLTVFDGTAGAAPSNPIAAFALSFAAVWMLVTVIPGFTVAVRRLHDSNLSGWWALLAVVPLGATVVLLLAMRRSRPEGARFDS